MVKALENMPYREQFTDLLEKLSLQLIKRKGDGGSWSHTTGHFSPGGKAVRRLNAASWRQRKCKFHRDLIYY